MATEGENEISQNDHPFSIIRFTSDVLPHIRKLYVAESNIGGSRGEGILVGITLVDVQSQLAIRLFKLTSVCMNPYVVAAQLLQRKT